MEDLSSSDKSKKRRLATTRGFDNSSVLGGVPPSDIPSFVTPLNSPSKFAPGAKSTPNPEQVQVITPNPVFPAPRPKVSLPLHPPFSPRRRLLPPRPPSPFPGISSIRTSVISPSLQTGAVSRDPSLDWDNFEESPSYNAVVDEFQNLQLSDCLRELGKTHTIPIVDTSESSLSVSSFTREMSVFSQQRPE